MTFHTQHLSLNSTYKNTTLATCFIWVILMYLLKLGQISDFLSTYNGIKLLSRINYCRSVGANAGTKQSQYLRHAILKGILRLTIAFYESVFVLKTTLT